MNADGSNQIRLTHNPAEDATPAWSPDGSKLAFMSRRDGNHEIFVMGADGATPTIITDSTVSLKLANLPPHDEVKLQFDLYIIDTWDGNTEEWGPDSFRVGYGDSRVNLLDETFDAFSFDDQSYQATRPVKYGNNIAFGWAPETIYRNLNDGFSFPHTGESLTLNSSATDEWFYNETWGIDNVKVTLGGSDTVLEYDFEGGAPEVWSDRRTNRDHPEHFTEFLGRFGNPLNRYPAWSRDGSKIAFQSLYDIFVMNADGRALTRLTKDYNAAAWPTWSPDGSKIGFMNEYWQYTNSEIWVVGVDGVGKTNLTNHPAGEGGSLSWSPGGSQIAFSSVRDHNAEIYVMDADGSNPTRLTNTPYEVNTQIRKRIVAALEKEFEVRFGAGFQTQAEDRLDIWLPLPSGAWRDEWSEERMMEALEMEFGSEFEKAFRISFHRGEFFGVPESRQLILITVSPKSQQDSLLADDF